MDRQLAERMVGAACLLAVLVFAVPSILDGNRRPDTGPANPEPADSLDLRTHTIRLDGEDRAPPVPQVRASPSEPGPAAQPDPTDALPVAAQPVTPPAIAAAPGTVGPGPAVVSPPGASSAPVPKGAPSHSAGRPAASVTMAARPAAPDLARSADEPADRVSDEQWFVQLGSFSRRDNAERLAAQLNGRGFTASILEGRGSKGSMFRVRAGPVPNRDEATVLSRQLAAAGYAGQIARR